MTKLLKIAAFAVPAFGILAIAQPARAVDAAGAAAAGAASAASAQTKASDTKKVCINVIPDTGSRMARRVCRTKAEWADQGVDLDARK